MLNCILEYIHEHLAQFYAVAAKRRRFYGTVQYRALLRGQRGDKFERAGGDLREITVIERQSEFPESIRASSSSELTSPRILSDARSQIANVWRYSATDRSRDKAS